MGCYAVPFCKLPTFQRSFLPQFSGSSSKFLETSVAMYYPTRYDVPEDFKFQYHGKLMEDIKINTTPRDTGREMRNTWDY
jgi:hypothetical protein